MHLLLLIGLIFAATVPVLSRRNRNRIPWLYAAGLLAGFGWFFFHLPAISDGGSVRAPMEWIPGLGLGIDLALDGLSMAFALLVTGVGVLVFLYGSSYMRSYPHRSRFFLYLFLFAWAMLGLVLSDNVILLFIFWELTTFLSYMLISFFHEKDEARAAAFQSLVITGLGGLSLLAGLILLGSVAGSYSFSDWVAQAESIRQSPAYVPALILVLLGAMTKSAQFPFHFWLPGAMQAPAPVSAYLHSATMVKAGFFLLARLNPVLGGTEIWMMILPLTGVLTMLIGSWFAITRNDLKSVLAFTTINALGVLVLLMGIDTWLSIKAALLFLFVHAFYKASLFMLAGMIEKKTGTRDIRELGGLARYMPLTAVVTFLLALSMAGLPPMLGFLGKELIYEAKIQLPGISSIILVLGVFSNILMVGIALLFFHRVFLGPRGSYTRTPGETSFSMLAGPIVLALASLVFGLAPGLLGDTLIESALEVVFLEYNEVKLKLWHGFNQVFFLSLFTVVAGSALAWLLIRREDLRERWSRLNDRVFGFSLTEAFSRTLEGFVRFAGRQERVLQHGYHRYYILTFVVFAATQIWAQVYVTRGWSLESSFSLKPFYISGLVAVIIVATVYSTLARSRLATIISLGVVGYGISLIYLYYSAVDLAITQVLVETLVVAMFALVLQRLPRFARLSSRWNKIRDLGIALFFGSVMTVVALKSIRVELNPPVVSEFFLSNSYPEAFGKNVVNVILVDFRALDTMGEVVVLTIAALGVSLIFGKKTGKA